ncbi:MAG: MBL fold metallo-hydrolase [Promethearchaeota archaeon]
MSFDFVKKLDFESEFFNLYKISESAYAAICKDFNSPMRSNAGFIDIGDYLIIVDTTLSIEAAKDLIKAATQYTQKEPNFVVITHFHLDHIMGNSLFDVSTQIMTSDRTLKNLQTEGKKRIEDIKNMDLKKLESSLDKITDELQRRRAEFELSIAKIIQSGSFWIREPNLTFKTGCVIHGNNKNVHLRTYQKAHTDGDVTIYIPEEKILFSGDLLFAKSDPWLGSGDPEGWISLIEELLEIDFKVAVPGHGELATKEEFLLESKYIKEILDLVKKKIDAGEDPNEIKREDFSEEIQPLISPMFGRNIDFLAGFLRKS